MFNYSICKVHSQEHTAVISLIGRLRNFLGRFTINQQPDWQMTDARTLMLDLKIALSTEIIEHFDFEEKELFPILEREGYADMVEILQSDHDLIRSLARQVSVVIEKIAWGSRPLDKSDWEILFRQGNVLITELSGHVEKEEAGMLPALDQVLDSESSEQMMREHQKSGTR